MAIITINLTDNFVQYVNKANDISNAVGDVATLVTGDDNCVDGINAVKALLGAFDDSSEIIQIARDNIFLTSPGGDGSLDYDSATGVFTYTGPGDSETRAHFSAGTGLSLTDGVFTISNGGIINELINDNTITSSKFSSVVSFQIKDSDGSVLKTIFSPGS